MKGGCPWGVFEGDAAQEAKRQKLSHASANLRSGGYRTLIVVRLLLTVPLFGAFRRETKRSTLVLSTHRVASIPQTDFHELPFCATDEDTMPGPGQSLSDSPPKKTTHTHTKKKKKEQKLQTKHTMHGQKWGPAPMAKAVAEVMYCRERPRG